jgi:hypothetical protein
MLIFHENSGVRRARALVHGRAVGTFLPVMRTIRGFPTKRLTFFYKEIRRSNKCQ